MRRVLRRALPVVLTCLALVASGTAVAAAVSVLSLPTLPTLPGGSSEGHSPTPRASGSPSSDANEAVPVVGMSQVAPLRRVVPPDLMAVAPKSIDAKTLEAIKSLDGVRETTTVDAGSVVLRGRSLDVFGVDPATFRPWTPPTTATSKKLWVALARNRFVVSHQAKRARQLELGRSYSIAGRNTSSVRLGASAALGVPGVDALVSEKTSKQLGLVPDLAVFVNAPGADIDTLREQLTAKLGKKAQVLTLRGQPGQRGGDGESSRDPARKASSYMQLYKQSAQLCPGLSWTVLAAIGQIESAHGRNTGPSSAGALGPMQFMPSTWSAYGVDGDGDGRAEIMNPYDAVPSAAKYLCANGAGGDREALRNAIWHYNHAQWYVNNVLALAEKYARNYG